MLRFALVQMDRANAHTGKRVLYAPNLKPGAVKHVRYDTKFRDIVGGHLFGDGNKRTAVKLVETAFERAVRTAPSNEKLWRAANGAANGTYKTVEEIAEVLK